MVEKCTYAVKISKLLIYKILKLQLKVVLKYLVVIYRILTIDYLLIYIMEIICVLYLNSI